MPGESFRIKYESRLKEMKLAREKDKVDFQHWLDNIPPERKEAYLKLDTMSGSDTDNKMEALRKCRFGLEIISTLKDKDGRTLIPRGLGVQNEDAIVYYRIEGDETKDWEKTFDEFTHSQRHKADGKDRYYCDINTTRFGLPATDGGIMKYELDAEEIEKRIAWMRDKEVS